MASVQRIVLLGKTGAGKSTSGNIILGSDKFDAKLSPTSVTQKCQEEKKEFDGKTLAIMDTPGLFHTTMDKEKLKDEILETIFKIQPGPHVFLLVLRLNSFSKEDMKVLDGFKKMFTDAKPHTIVLFTHEGEGNVDQFIKNNKCLDEFIEKSSVGYHVFNIEDTDDAQVTDLLEKISKVVQENKGKYYQNKMLEEAEEAFNKMMQQSEEEKQEVGKWIQLMQQGLTKFEKYDPGLFKTVENFLKCVQNITYTLMPDDCKT